MLIATLATQRSRRSSDDATLAEIPGLCGHLDWVPRAAEGRRIAQIEIVQTLDRHAVVDRRGENVDTLRDLRSVSADDLSA